MNVDTITENMVLQDEVVVLTPFELVKDLQTVLDLVMKCRFTRISRESAFKVLLRHRTMFWYGRIKGNDTLLGVVYLTKAPAGWMIDAYRDDALMKSIDNVNATEYSYRAGKLVSDFAMKFTDKLLTAHDFKHRAATILAKKLGFKEDYIIMQKER